MTSREKFEAFLVSEYEWGNDALNAANFHGDDATGYYTGGDFIYDGQSCSECLFWAWRGWQAAELAAEKKLTDMAVQLANAESKCRELAAENAGLNAAFDRPDAWLSWHSIPPTFYEPDRGGEYLQVHEHPGEKNDDGSDSWAVYSKPESETPATDAFLAEVRAQGVEMAACALDDVNQFNYANMLDDLAQKIRKEAAQ
ncbi:hypothetical protein FKL07_23220 [Citrobacter freundii]|nr:hypothetical protein [Citrobacter freundii]